MKLFISEPHERHAGPILVGDENNNDIAEFFHSDHATVSQSYETALALAQKLVGMTVLDEVAARRQEQIAKGYDAAHDDEHSDGSIARAAAAYAAAGAHGVDHLANALYPWINNVPKVKSSRDAMIHAAALCIAEIERIDRAYSVDANVMSGASTVTGAQLDEVSGSESAKIAEDAFPGWKATKMTPAYAALGASADEPIPVGSLHPQPSQVAEDLKRRVAAGQLRLINRVREDYPEFVEALERDRSQNICHATPPCDASLDYPRRLCSDCRQLAQVADEALALSSQLSGGENG